ncbi:homeobox domain-containing protein [Ditylenchus destructor]|uniref:Homeobox domain-containing protein n=1 Tax=Ditylenchus destructor TaxID=166010 RepID=A0AAD4RD76_9BILA|nr:homeobox domain-containing protein [Ditylenchus destructor]
MDNKSGRESTEELSQSSQLLKVLKPVFTWDELNDRLIKMDEARLACDKCSFIADTSISLEQHSFSEHSNDDTVSSGPLIKVEDPAQTVSSTSEKCPLCSEKISNMTADSDEKTLRGHLFEVHKIVEESVLDQLCQTTGIKTELDESPDDNKTLMSELKRAEGEETNSAIYRHRCSQPGCVMAFKSVERLRQHELSHSTIFRLIQKCPFCDAQNAVEACRNSYANSSTLRQHIEEHHLNSAQLSNRCEDCEENFESFENWVEHLASLKHKERTMRAEERTETELNQFNDAREERNTKLNDQVFSLLMRHPSPLLPPPPQFSHLLAQHNQFSQSSSKSSCSSQSKPFRCNVCRQAYGQPATFDTHLRSLSHINQMNRLQQLVESGQVDPLKPVSEQPGGPPQKLIVEVLNANNLGMCQTSTDSKQDFVPPMLNPFFMVGANAMIEESESGGVDLSMKRKKVSADHSMDKLSTAASQFNFPSTTASKNQKVLQSQQKSRNSSQTSSPLPQINGGQQSQMAAAQLMMAQAMMSQMFQQQNGTETNPQANWLATMSLMAQTQQAAQNHSPLLSMMGNFGPDATTAINPLAMLGLSQVLGNGDAKTSKTKPSSSKHADLPSEAKTGGALWRALEEYRFELAEHIENLDEKKLKVDKIPECRIADIVEVECPTCKDTSSTIWEFKEHFQENHGSSSIPGKVIQQFATKLQEAILEVDIQQSDLNSDQSDTENLPATASSAPPTSSTPSGKRKELCNNEELETKRLRADSTPAPTLSSGETMAQTLLNTAFVGAGLPKTPQRGGKPRKGLNEVLAAMRPKEQSKITPSPPSSLANMPTSDSLSSMMMSMSNPLASSAFNPFLAAAAGLNPTSMSTPNDIAAAAAAMAAAMNNNNNAPAPSNSTGLNTSSSSDAYSENSPQKRARTRITDEQLKVLRLHFDINNSPSEDQIREMSVKAGLPEKVIKHWFRNTLFKERQRDKDSPYNFNVPPQMSIDLATYEKTGEAKVTSLKQETDSSECGQGTSTIFSPNEIKSSHEVKREMSTPPASPPMSVEEGENSRETHDNTEGRKSTQNSEAAAAALTQQQIAAVPSFASFFGGLGSLKPTSMMGSDVPSQEDKSTLSSMLQGLTSPFPGFPVSTAISSSPNANIRPTSTNSSAGMIATSSLVNTSSASNAPSLGTGRRANRTRFTDFQLRTLQNFFDKQAYPKDDDLEMLSKKLGLSPRVIVVWFQNARQKARKIYENQPNNMDNHERFVRTPGANFQCKRCQLVFQRYYELIQHQQKVCYINDGDAQQTDNKSLEEILSEDEKNANFLNGLMQHSAAGADLTANIGNENQQQATLMASTFMNSLLTADALEKFNLNNGCTGAGTEEAGDGNTQQDLLKLISSSGRPSSEAMLKMFKNKEKKRQFYKRCPFCGLLFQAKEKLLVHLSERHSEQLMTAAVDIDALPDAEDVPIFSFSTTEELLNRINNAQDEETNNTQDDHNSQMLTRASPLDLRCNQNNEEEEQQHSSVSPYSDEGDENRYRTHLTPLQVYVMKSLFNDYKTPSMSECEVLGREIGLHKRVVQVWFQNARAKERKSKGEEDSVSLNNSAKATTHCELCSVEFSATATAQDHIFTRSHIENVKERGFSLRGMSNSSANDENVQSEDSGENKSSKGISNDRQSSGHRSKSVREPTSKRGSTGAQSGDLNAQYGNQFPYNLIYGAQLPPMIYDQNLIGTPVSLLQITSSVANQITHDMANGRNSSKFTQDGLQHNQLSAKVSEVDFKCSSTSESEVGWACPQCCNVFQQEDFLRNHQKLICQGCDGTFRLIQIHYDCAACQAKFGTQDEFRAHCETAPHKTVASVYSSSEGSAQLIMQTRNSGTSTTSC